jgi:hypothetical protein
MSGEVSTTNLLLGIMAAVSVLEALVVIGVGIAGFLAYRQVVALLERGMVLAQGLEARQVAPAMLRVNAILDDLKDVTTKVKAETDRVDHAIHTTIDRLDQTADRVRMTVRGKTGALVGFIRGARVGIESMLRSDVRTSPVRRAAVADPASSAHIGP